MHNSRGLRLRLVFPGLFITCLWLMPLGCQSKDNEPTDTHATGGAAASGGNSPASGGRSSSSGGTSATGGHATASGGDDSRGGEGGDGGDETQEGSGGAENDCVVPSHQIKCDDYEIESTVCFTVEELSDPCSVVHLLRVHPSSDETAPSDLADEQLNDVGDTDDCPGADELYFGRFRCGLGVTPTCENAVRRVNNTCCYVALSNDLLC